LATRLGRSPDEFEIRVYTGAVIGAMMAAILPLVDDPSADFVALIEQAFDYVEKGMPI
jgi:hypothetical protein